nr:hypothetical protein [Anaerolineae bacterium]
MNSEPKLIFAQRIVGKAMSPLMQRTEDAKFAPASVEEQNILQLARRFGADHRIHVFTNNGRTFLHVFERSA